MTYLPILRLGFRPFFFFGILHALLAMVFWVAYQSGAVTWNLNLSPILWHAHEMIFGFVTAIISGFILTATQNWTGIRGIHGKQLAFLVGLWLLPRILIFFPDAKWLFTILDLAFYPALSILLWPYLKHPQQRKNLVFYLLFSFLFLADFAILMSQWGYSDWARPAYYLALHTVVSMIVLVGGRVLPFFTEKALVHSHVHRISWIEKLSLPSMLLFAVTYFISPNSFALVATSVFAFFVHLTRWLAWRPHQTYKKPILAILFIGYFWIPIGLLLYTLSALHLFSIMVAAHAFGIGVVGIVIYAMVNRVSLGHTGRVIHASPIIVLGYTMLVAATLIRVIIPTVAPQSTLLSIKISGTLWIVAYLILFIYNMPILLKARVDGKDG